MIEIPEIDFEMDGLNLVNPKKGDIIDGRRVIGISIVPINMDNFDDIERYYNPAKQAIYNDMAHNKFGDRGITHYSTPKIKPYVAKGCTHIIASISLKEI